MTRHSARWYDALARSLGHAGFVTLGEIRAAERADKEET